MHRQLAQQLRSAIAAGTYKTGDRIPAEPELALTHGVSRITARQAVMHLASAQLVVRRQGKGTFVAEPPVHHDLLDPHGIFNQLVAKGAPIEYTLCWANAEAYEFVLRLRGAVPITSSMQGIK